MAGITYSTLKNTELRNGQLKVDTIERICIGLNIPMSEFFEEPQA
nr:MAG TPA: SOS-response transcriptional repressor [Caudoviricetes sp.]